MNATVAWCDILGDIHFATALFYTYIVLFAVYGMAARPARTRHFFVGGHPANVHPRAAQGRL